jgi:hypothetical protein
MRGTSHVDRPTVLDAVGGDAHQLLIVYDEGCQVASLHVRGHRHSGGGNA